jgi:hypothetical protein
MWFSECLGVYTYRYLQILGNRGAGLMPNFVDILNVLIAMHVWPSAASPIIGTYSLRILARY